MKLTTSIFSSVALIWTCFMTIFIFCAFLLVAKFSLGKQNKWSGEVFSYSGKVFFGPGKVFFWSRNVFLLVWKNVVLAQKSVSSPPPRSQRGLINAEEGGCPVTLHKNILH